ncbi:substrate-binding periplasmic protein [Shewanella psychrotolerans]|uniref:substrate-binding periplasmic protein n=1 Tax=Shewanella psychrotolerans TaxID=2864206 RepID=UPI001C655C2D|nr:ABC transporter substrate-binding protein [Shewanella psychrotolerans]QYK01284.1 ABC transporter substrate-binding protein [Shewanella psychrotolerans]
MVYRFIWSLLLLCLLSLKLVSAEPITISIVGEEMIDYSNRDGSGYYLDLVRRIFPEPEWQLNVDLVPFARSLYLVEQKRADMGLGVYSGDVSSSYYSREPIEVDKVDVAVTPELAAIWKGVSSLKQKKVQAMLEYRFDSFVNVPMYYEENSDLLQMLNHVNSGRIDAVMYYKDEMEKLSTKLHHPRQYVIIENVLAPAVYFVFAHTPKGERLKVIFDSKMDELIQSGEVDKIFHKYMPNRDRLQSIQ